MAAPAPDAYFETMYRRHARDVYRFALAVVRNPTEAEDVTQTTFLNAYRALQRGESPERPRSWLFAIAHNAIRSRHRWSLRRPKEVPLENEEHRLAVPEAEREDVVGVLKALGELPRNQREALALRELEGLSYGEIAAMLGVSVTAVESLISRARRTLRRQRATLRSLTLLQLPSRLRGLVEQGGGGVAAKAAAVVAAATAAAGVGAVAHDHGAAARSAGLQPARAAVLVSEWPRQTAVAAAPARAAARVVPAGGRHAPPAGSGGGGNSSSGGGGGGSSDAAPPAAPAPQAAPAPAAPAAAAPAPSTSTGPVATAVSATVDEAATAVQSAVQSTVQAAAPAAVTVTVPDVPPLPALPPVTVPVPLPPPPAVTTPQGTLPGGIK